MKKLFLLTLILSCTLLTHAQHTKSLGVQLGFTQPITRLNAPILGKETTLSPTTYNGVKLGVIYDESIVKGFGYALGLNYSYAGNSTDWESKYTHSIFPKVRSVGQYHQLELAVDWQYKIEIAHHTWLIIYTGPTMEVGLSFKKNWHIKNDNNTTLFDKVENHYDTYKRVNVTWGVGGGFQYERYFLRGGYDFGLFNPYQEQMFAGKDIYTRGRFDQWQLKLGMYLWQK